MVRWLAAFLAVMLAMATSPLSPSALDTRMRTYSIVGVEGESADITSRIYEEFVSEMKAVSDRVVEARTTLASVQEQMQSQPAVNTLQDLKADLTVHLDTADSDPWEVLGQIKSKLGLSTRSGQDAWTSPLVDHDQHPESYYRHALNPGWDLDLSPEITTRPTTADGDISANPAAPQHVQEHRSRGHHHHAKHHSSAPAMGLTIMSDLPADMSPMKGRQHVDMEGSPKPGEDTGGEPVRSRLKRCVFLHGTGQVDPRPPSDEFDAYWGNVSAYTPQCSERVFVHVDSVHNAWHDKVLYEEYCRVAAHDKRHGAIIRDTIVFSHSAGSLILASGIEAGACDFDASSSSWYIIGYHPPSMINITSAVSMYGLTNYSVVRSLTSELGQYITSIHWVDEQGHPMRMYQCFNEMKDECKDMPDVFRRQRIADIVKQRVSGAMCGCSPRGLNMINANALQLISWAWADEPNDGMVPCGPCMSSMGANFSTSFQSNFYAAQLNHQDITCLNGDGDSDDVKACSWYRGCV